MKIDFMQLFEKGFSGKLRFGFGYGEILGILGAPDDVGGTSRKYKCPSVLRYSFEGYDVQLFFNQKSKVFDGVLIPVTTSEPYVADVCIASRSLDMLFTNTKDVENWFVTEMGFSIREEVDSIHYERKSDRASVTACYLLDGSLNKVIVMSLI